jgi:hypothetical protein
MGTVRVERVFTFHDEVLDISPASAELLVEARLDCFATLPAETLNRDGHG